MAAIDRILFGDNQFFGVNHMSEEKARQQLVRFKDTSAIIAVLDDAYQMGIRTFMCTTYDRVGEICDHMRADPASGTATSSISRACPTHISTPTR